MVSGKVSFQRSPTEDAEKLGKAIARFFPPSLSSNDDFLKFREAVFSRKILDTVRSRLLANIDADSTTLLLHRQALMAGKISVCDEDSESPLGVILLKITDSDINAFINWLTPETINGVPVTR